MNTKAYHGRYRCTCKTCWHRECSACRGLVAPRGCPHHPDAPTFPAKVDFR